jgi:two-component system response regulator HydG
VRELEHVVERLVLLGRAPEIQRAELPEAILNRASKANPSFAGSVLPIRELQRRYAIWALEQFGGHKGKTATALDIDDKTLAKWLTEKR